MKKLLSASLFTVIFCSISCFSPAQNTGSNLKKATVYPAANANDLQDEMQTSNVNDDSQDSLIKAKLVDLAVNNPEINVADANIKIAQYGLNEAKSSWLGSLNLSSNVNEFVIDGTLINGVAASTYYPKYNVGLSVPMDIFSKTKGGKEIATQNIVVAKAMKENKIRLIKQEVLTRYENYKEKKELARLQKISTEGDNDAYIAAQKSYADGTMQLGEMNRTYQEYINSQSKAVSCQHDLNIATIDLEEMIGVPIGQVLQNNGQ